MKSLRYAIVAAWMAFGVSLAHASADRVGTTSANFLASGSGASALGMSGAVLGLNGGLTAATWNPGALGYVREAELALAHAGLEDDSNQEWASFGGLMGAAKMRWSLTGIYQGFGTFEGRTASNASTGTFSVSSMAFGGSVARPIGRYGALGVGAKWVNENLGPSMRGSGISFDAGLLAHVGAIGFGLAGQNLGGQMSFGGVKYPFPTNVGAGLSYTHPNSGIRADLDLNFPNAYYTNVRAGAEWMWKDYMALRLGYRHELGAPSGETLSGPSFGCGGGTHGVWVDYGFVVTEGGQGQHRMGLSLRPSKMGWTTDPFGQNKMPRSFDDKPAQGPEPAPKQEPKK